MEILLKLNLAIPTRDCGGYFGGIGRVRRTTLSFLRRRGTASFLQNSIVLISTVWDEVDLSGGEENCQMPRGDRVPDRYGHVITRQIVTAECRSQGRPLDWLVDRQILFVQMDLMSASHSL